MLILPLILYECVTVGQIKYHSW